MIRSKKLTKDNCNDLTNEIYPDDEIFFQAPVKTGAFSTVSRTKSEARCIDKDK